VGNQKSQGAAALALAVAVALAFAFALAFAVALAFLSVIPEGNLLLPLLLPLPLPLLLPLSLPSLFFLSFLKGICCCILLSYPPFPSSTHDPY
jgi:hypothetical protein